MENGPDGAVRFAALIFGLRDLGTHIYTIREAAVSDEAYIPDESIYRAIVTVTREDGWLRAAVVYERDGSAVAEEEVVFRNQTAYVPPEPVSLTLGGQKTFSGSPESAAAPAFTFLLQENSQTIDSKTIQGAETISSTRSHTGRPARISTPCGRRRERPQA